MLVVRVDGRLGRDQVPPGLVLPANTHGRVFYPDVSYDFFPYAGIHRRVELVVTPLGGIHDVLLVAVPDEDGAVVSVTVEADEGDITLALDGEPITSPHRVGKPALWSPSNPRLHRLEVELRRRGELVDRYVLRTGIRTVSVAGDRLLLNGEPVQLRGFGRHEDFPVLGRGTASALNARDLLLMRQIGANSFRTAHYPCDEETLDIADQLGLMVIAETPAVGLYFADDDTPRRQQQVLRSLAEMIARDRNRACVIAWSVANEPRMNHPAAAAALASCATRPGHWTGPGRLATRPTCRKQRAWEHRTSSSSTPIPAGTATRGSSTPPGLPSRTRSTGSTSDTASPSCSRSSAPTRCPAATRTRPRCGPRSTRRN